ncbi:MAG: hypothetical protein H7A41_08385 [Chlamydiales bacterium]|nr:hypothetical protein [Chlamydiia bacterium]MCP5505153.1 hypothetical protein [Chlamydiales bacterium]
MSDRQKLSRLLDDLADKQKHVAQCHDYYEALEKEIEKKRKGLANPEEYQELEGIIAALNREYVEKSDLLMEELNNILMKGYDLSKKIGKEIAHDFKKLWDYMTQSMRAEVQLERVLRDIEYIKKELF